MPLSDSLAGLPKSIAPLLLALAVAGCGDSSSGGGTTTPDDNTTGGEPGGDNNGGGNDSQPTVVSRTSLLGLAVDPYIAGARLCADLNQNQTCDDDEPSGTTNDLGEFDLGQWPEGHDQVQILVENQGSWQVPQYGLHEGKPYGMPLSIVISRDVEVASETSPLPEVLMTPATTLQASYGLAEVQLLALINQFQTQLGREITAEDLSTDPVSLYGKIPVADLANEDLAVFRVYLALYATNRILSSLQSLDEGLGDQFAARLTDNQSPEYRVLEIILDSIARATASNVLAESQAQIDLGQQQMDDAIRAQTPDQAETLVLNDVPDFPALTTDVVMAIGVTIIEYELQRTQALVTQLFEAGDSNFDQIAAAAADQLEGDFQQGGTGQQLETHIPVLGVRTYGVVNKAHFLNYQTRTYIQGTPSNMGDLVFGGIVAGSPDLALGFNCKSSGFFAFDDEGTIHSSCTSSLPTSLQQSLAGFNGSAEAPDEDNSPVDLGVWDNIPQGSLWISDSAENLTCSLSGTVYYTPEGSDSAVPAPNVPLYLTYGGENQEINIKTDAEGNFSFKRIPARKYIADGWPEEEVTGTDHYFFGVIAGKRRPVPEYYDYEANADYHFNCRLPVATDQAGAGGPGHRNEDGELVFDSANIQAYPLLKPVVDGTEISGRFPTEMVGEGFNMEIHSSLRSYQGEGVQTSAAVNDGGWIMDSVNAHEHPFTSYDAADNSFSIRALAGGSYRLRPGFPAQETDDSGQPIDVKIECSSAEFDAPSGQNTEVSIALQDFESTQPGVVSNCYYTEGKAGPYGKKLVISVP